MVDGHAQQGLAESDGLGGLDGLLPLGLRLCLCLGRALHGVQMWCSEREVKKECEQSR